MSNQLGDQDYRDIIEVLWPAKLKWYYVGLRLKVGKDELDTIDQKAGNDVEVNLRQMVSSRLRMADPCTWTDIYEALKHPTVGMNKVAEDVKKEKLNMPKEECRLPDRPQTMTTEVDDLKGNHSSAQSSSSLSFPTVSNNKKGLEMEETGKKIADLQRTYTQIIRHAVEYIKSRVSVEDLRYAVLFPLPSIKKEHKKLFVKAKTEVKEAESIDDIFFVVGDHSNFLSYSLVSHVINQYGNDELKKEIAEYSKRMAVFRRETRLVIFCEVCDDKPEKDNSKISTVVTKHQMDWATATLEDVEYFRKDVCRELSLYDFSLYLQQVARGCVEITWLVPCSLVAYIQKSIKPSSPSMMKHHVSTLTIDGFIAYDRTAAMQNKHKVIRLAWQAIQVHYSYMLDEMSPDAVVPYLVERRLLSSEQAKEVNEVSSRPGKVTTILQALDEKEIVGRLPTFCAALISAGLSQLAERLTEKFHYLLKDEVLSHALTGDDVVISGDVASPPSPPPPDSHLITAQVEGTTLTQTQYDTISSLICSLLCLPTAALVYDGHTCNPLTLHWHCTEGEKIEPAYSTGLLSEMAVAGIQVICTGKEIQSVIPNRNEMKLFEASWDGDVEELMCILESGVSVDITRPDGSPSLVFASQNGHVEVVDKLLQHGASVDLQSKNGNSSLMVASQNGHVEVVDKLLQHGARVDLQEENGWHPLMYASENGHVEAVDKLLQHGARVDLQEEDGWHPLMYASQNGHVEVVDKLLQHGARVDLQSKNGVSSLMPASQNGHVEVVDKLLQHGARVDLQEENGWHPLMYASASGHVEVVDKLLQHGARVDLQSKNGVSSLIMASQNGHVEVVDKLLQHGARVDLQKEVHCSCLNSILHTYMHCITHNFS